MAIYVFKRWINLLKGQENNSFTQEDIFLVSGTPESYSILKKYFQNVHTLNTIGQFSLFDIIFHRHRFAGKPAKTSLSLLEKIKRFIVCFTCPDYERIAGIWNLFDLVFLPTRSTSIFMPGAFDVEIYKTHFPKFFVNEITRHTKKSRNFLIYLLAKLSQNRLQDQNDGITVFANFLDVHLLMAYRLLHPNKTIFIRLHDRIDQIFGKTQPDTIRKKLQTLLNSNIIQGAESYNEKEATFLNIQYRPNAVNSQVLAKIDARYRNYFYTFIGVQKTEKDPSRLRDLKEVRDALIQYFPSACNYINEHLILRKDIIRKRIPYPKYLELIGQSEIMVDLYRIDTNEGLSFRIPEALILSKKVITNRLIILTLDCYDPSRFFIIGHDSINRLKEFIEGEFKPLPGEIERHYDCLEWWQ